MVNTHDPSVKWSVYGGMMVLVAKSTPEITCNEPVLLSVSCYEQFMLVIKYLWARRKNNSKFFGEHIAWGFMGLDFILNLRQRPRSSGCSSNVLAILYLSLLSQINSQLNIRGLSLRFLWSRCCSFQFLCLFFKILNIFKLMHSWLLVRWIAIIK